MSERSIESGDDLSLTRSRLEWVAARCDDFEQAWRDGLKPRLEDYLKGHVAPDQSALLYHLLGVELELRAEDGAAPVLEEYLDRFRDHATLVRCVFDFESPSEGPSRTTLLTTQFKVWTQKSGEPWNGTVEEPSSEPMLSARARSLARTEDGTGREGDPLLKLRDRFTLIRLVGMGMYGEVYLARDEVLGRDVAIKIPHVGTSESSLTMTTSLNEAQSTAQLQHTGIVTIHDVVTLDDGTMFVVMEYVEGLTLRHMIKAGAIARDQGVELIAQVAEALYYAHTKGFVHRDIKPANILIDPLGKPRVTDFGLAVHQATQAGRSGELAGTVPYMAPEQVQGDTHRLDGRTDIWALGVILYEILTGGRRPFIGANRATVFKEIVSGQAKPPCQLDHTIPRELERICLRCLSKQMTDRYSTAADLADDLRSWLTARSSVEDSIVRQCGAIRPVKVVPKGLRSFSLEDASFFMELVPGPRDRDGVPEVVKFWKTRIEATDRETAFTVGLIFGPSGCGKSSLVHAGILPGLTESVVTVSIAAGTSSQATEAELLYRLRHRCPNLARDEEIDLPEALRRLRQANGLAAGKKLLIVLDQFEQYLQSSAATEHSPLIAALRQCDGEHVQCLVLVRDGFWTVLSRFLRMLEIKLSSDRNMTVIDLFDRRHAWAVLAALGRGHGTLPEDPEALTSEQKKFLDLAIDGLAADNRVTCVRLALFAEIFKDRPWTLASLKKLGGMPGVGLACLEATIGSRARHPLLAHHAEATRAILKSLLPNTGSPLKGRIRSYFELLTATGYAKREVEFRELLQVLYSEPRLLTPAEETKSAELTTLSLPATIDDQDTLAERDWSQSFYQLTHDYLVPSIRDWLGRNHLEPKQGRMLYWLAGLITLQPRRLKPRNLPSFLEWLSLCWHTRRREWSPATRQMMAVAMRRLGLWLLAMCTVMGLLISD